MKLLMLLTLMWTPTGQDAAPRIIVTSVSCFVMETCLLPCSFDSSGGLLRVHWIKQNLLVHAYKPGMDLLDKQDVSYRGRTSIFPQQISGGNASLQLSALTVKDQGTYHCICVTDKFGANTEIHLRVESRFSAPSLELRGDVLVCSSEGIYPKPRLDWTPLSEHRPHTNQTENQLYSISSSITLEPHPPQHYTCNVSTDSNWKSATYSLKVTPVSCLVMETCLLPCSFDDTERLLLVQWVKDNLLVHAYKHDMDLLDKQDVSYRGRTSMFPQQISGGNASLQLSALTVKDQGTYQCLITTVHGRTEQRTLLTPDKGSGAAVIWGIVAGFVVMILILIVTVVVLRRKHQKKHKKPTLEEQALLLKAGVETDIIRRMLQDVFSGLSDDEREQFRSFLTDESVMEGFRIIPRNELEEEGDVSELLMKDFGLHSITITKRVLQKLQRNDLKEKLAEWKYDPKEIIKTCENNMKSRAKFLSEELSDSSKNPAIIESYTELLVTDGGSGRSSEEHEVDHVERTLQCQDIFKGHTQEGQPIRTVLTQGVSGVGKTVLTQRISLDWAEGRVLQDVQLLIPFTFRKLNRFSRGEFSLVGLLHHCFRESKQLCSFQYLQLLFILDGLDECRLSLDFSETQVLTRDTESASVEELLVNLIRGNLLPSARIWITTRPAAASQIPAEYVSMMTEMQGFNAVQKEQYFRKRFRDEQEVTAVIAHINTSFNLYVMSSIPVFSSIFSTVLLHLMKRPSVELPSTLTQMFLHFLVLHVKAKKFSFHRSDLHWTPETKKMVWSLGKLAFEQLQKENRIFYESDLSECGLNDEEFTHHSEVFTLVGQEEPGRYEDKVYWFNNLHVQAFLAALFSSVENLPQDFKSPDPAACDHSVMDQVLQSPNRHMDLFLHFLLGISLSSNQRLLPYPQTGLDQMNQETVKYIHRKLNEEGMSAEKSLSLLYCLNELNDRTLLEQIQRVLDSLSNRNKSPAQWSALSFLLLSSHSDLEHFDLRKYQASEHALLNLLPVVKASTKVTLSGCGLTSGCCGVLASALSSSSSLTDLDLSNNDLQDSGLEQLCEGLKSSHCRLNSLRLSGCLVSERGGNVLAEALSSAPHQLRRLDLSYNHLGVSTERLPLILETLRLDPSGEHWMKPGLKKYACEFSLDPNTANAEVSVSKDKLSVLSEDEEMEQQDPDHEDRFTIYRQALSSTGLSGRCYWEVDWKGDVDIAVSYRGISRGGKGQASRFGFNDQSWSLRFGAGQCSVWHNKRETKLPRGVGGASGRVGVFLDWEGGALSFYGINSDGKLSHIFTFDNSFTEDVFPGFGVNYIGDHVHLVNQNQD